jgi:hypothetical protein
LGEHVWKGSDNQGQYQVNFRRQKGQMLVHVIYDLSHRSGFDFGHPPEYIQLQINGDLIPFQAAKVFPQNEMAQVSGQGAWKSLEIYPNPEVTIVLK